jgi:hypothetical protein
MKLTKTKMLIMLASIAIIPITLTQDIKIHYKSRNSYLSLYPGNEAGTLKYIFEINDFNNFDLEKEGKEGDWEGTSIAFFDSDMMILSRIYIPDKALIKQIEVASIKRENDDHYMLKNDNLAITNPSGDERKLIFNKGLHFSKEDGDKHIFRLTDYTNTIKIKEDKVNFGLLKLFPDGFDDLVKVSHIVNFYAKYLNIESYENFTSNQDDKYSSLEKLNTYNKLCQGKEEYYITINKEKLCSEENKKLFGDKKKRKFK